MADACAYFDMHEQTVLKMISDGVLRSGQFRRCGIHRFRYEWFEDAERRLSALPDGNAVDPDDGKAMEMALAAREAGRAVIDSWTRDY